MNPGTTLKSSGSFWSFRPLNSLYTRRASGPFPVLPVLEFLGYPEAQWSRRSQEFPSGSLNSRSRWSRRPESLVRLESP
ncbi:hypothetical protein CW304_27425 [Bacillus sp. UFRGS-B20]|nr:hypothetical protein CW304_27425 [Bacillus sp. UFRGS-B20]